MPNLNPTPAGSASASLLIESNRQQVNAPAAAEAVQRPQAITLSTGEQIQLENYTVKKGDTLWDIAGVKMGNPNNWPVLFALNKDKIINPDLIHPGQVLSIPSAIKIAPSVPAQPLPNPVDGPPAPQESAPVQPVVEPVQPTAAAEESFTPSQPAQIENHSAEQGPVLTIENQEAAVVPAAEEHTATEAPQPAPATEQPGPPVLRHPDQLPAAAAEQPVASAVSQEDLEWALNLQTKITEQGYAPTPEEAARYTRIAEGQAPEPTQTTQPAPAPQAPQPIQAEPKHNFSTIGQPGSGNAKGGGVGKAALIGGAVGTIGTGAVLIGLTAKIGSNLGGYATAQKVVSGINTVTTKVGLKLPTGPALSKLVSKVGGPKVAGTVAAVGTGLVVAGLAAGGYYLYQKATAKDEPAKQPSNQPPAQPPIQAAATAPVQAPVQTPAPSQALTQAELDWAVDLQSKITDQGYAPNPTEQARYTEVVERYQQSEAAAQPPAQPVATPSPAQPAPANVAPLFDQLDKLLKEKKYMFVGGAAQPDQVRATGVQIWLDGQLADRVKLANTLVSNGQSDLLGRVMSHEETTEQDISQVMSQAQFPVSAYMKALDDNKAFLVLNSLANVAARGDTGAAGVIGQTVTAYDGWRDREAPFNQLRSHHQAQGTWNALPSDLRSKIDELLK